MPIRCKIAAHKQILWMTLVLQLLPINMKKQMWCPIPKSTPGETRLLSLLHDDLCFILGVVTLHYSAKCEDTEMFPNTIRAYRKGMGMSHSCHSCGLVHKRRCTGAGSNAGSHWRGWEKTLWLSRHRSAASHAANCWLSRTWLHWI